MMSNYLKIEKFSLNNGVGIGATIFFSGCDKEPKCKGCFNSEAWSFNAGQPFTQETIDEIISLLANPHINHLSLLGGEPLADKNVYAVQKLVNEVKQVYPEKKIWLWTWRTWEEILKEPLIRGLLVDEFGALNGYPPNVRHSIVKKVDILVDGQFIEKQKDLTLAFKGSSNQRVINVQESLKQCKVVLYED